MLYLLVQNKFFHQLSLKFEFADSMCRETFGIVHKMCVRVFAHVCVPGSILISLVEGNHRCLQYLSTVMEEIAPVLPFSTELTPEGSLFCLSNLL